MKKIVFLMFWMGLLGSCGAQQTTPQYSLACIAFYNVENLFDTIDDPYKLDEEFLPEGTNGWSSARYKKKVADLSKVISLIGAEKTKTAPVIVGLCEIENKNVIVDLTRSESLLKYDYEVVHYNSPDRRGVDVGLIYQKSRFTVLSSRSYRLEMPSDTNFRTRDPLLVSGILDQSDTIHIIVNHWPSRRGGEKQSAPKRFAAATLIRNICDSLLNANPMAKIIIMGDLNDNPNDKSITQHLNAKGKLNPHDALQLFNTSAELYKDGVGSYAYRDVWSLFDQMIISRGLYKETTAQQWGYYYLSTFIFNDPMLTQQTGNFKGYPFRTYGGGRYQGGYSDHFPTYMLLVKQIQFIR